MWYNLAASQLTHELELLLGVHDAEALRLLLKGVVPNRDQVADRMNPTQIAEAQRLAREWDAVHPSRPGLR